jgi:hypothetical protein
MVSRETALDEAVSKLLENPSHLTRFKICHQRIMRHLISSNGNFVDLAPQFKCSFFSIFR